MPSLQLQTEVFGRAELRIRMPMVETPIAGTWQDGMTENWLHIPGCFPGISYTEASIGPVVTKPAYRGTRAGHKLMQESIVHTLRLSVVRDPYWRAQLYLNQFYRSLGSATRDFNTQDGMPHIEMIFSK